PPASGSRPLGRPSLRRSSRLNRESQLPEHLDGPALPALEITSGKTLASRELVRRAQNRLGRITAFLPNQVIRRGGGESMRRKEPLRPQPVVLLYRPQHIGMGHLVP